MDHTRENSQPRKFRGIWFKTAFIFQLLTSAVHSISFLSHPEGTNETEKQMLDLMSTYKNDMGAGFTPTMMDLFNSLSAGFALLFLLGGLLNWYLWKKETDKSILKGVIIINTIIFGISFTVNVFLSFLPPVILSGLVFVFLLLSWITFPKKFA